MRIILLGSSKHRCYCMYVPGHTEDSNKSCYQVECRTERQDKYTCEYQ